MILMLDAHTVLWWLANDRARPGRATAPAIKARAFAGALALSVGACAPAAVATGAPSVPPTHAVVTQGPATPGPAPSATRAVLVAPAGAVVVQMYGPPPRFRPTSLTATAGEVVFFLKNDSPRSDALGSHNLVIGDVLGGERVATSEEVPVGGRAIFAVPDLPAGTYAIWCSLFGHDTLGQTGTLTVE